MVSDLQTFLLVLSREAVQKLSNVVAVQELSNVVACLSQAGLVPPFSLNEGTLGVTKEVALESDV